MNPTGVLFIRQAGGERPASHADPATFSSLGIWQRNFNGRATQAGRSVQETHCACQSELTSRREHSKCAALLAWQSVTSIVEGKEDNGRMKGCGKAAVKGSRGTTVRYWAAESGEGSGGGWKARVTRAACCASLTNKEGGAFLIIFYLCLIQNVFRQEESTDRYPWNF